MMKFPNYHEQINKACGFFVISILLLLMQTGCKKFVEADTPVGSVTAATTYNNNATAAAVMSGVYTNMTNNSIGLSSGGNSVSLLEGLAADELINYNTTLPIFAQFYQNGLTSSTAGVSNNYFWKEVYQQIHATNAVIEELANSSGVTPAIKRQLDGEAKFIRAFYHFYAVNIYGDIPLVLASDYRVNNIISRSSKADVYKQIVKDLNDALAELGNNFVDANGNTTTERIRPNKGTAQALLARVYLYTKDWANAKNVSDALIANTTNYLILTDLTAVFKKNSKEAIWQLPPVSPTGANTWDASYFVLTSTPGTATLPVALSNTVVNAFEPNDRRLMNWVNAYKPNSTITYYYPFKYQIYKSGDPVSEYLMVFRLAEQYLIRAEAKAQLGDISGGLADLNLIRSRANLPAATATDLPSFMIKLLHERQTELFTEWGHRWFDLIRTDNINSVMGSPVNITQNKGGAWSPNAIVAPLPLAELTANPNLTQNVGY